MPFFRARDKLIYFAHVPKCAGGAVENYLRERFGKLGFFNRRFHTGEHWTRSAPQHVTAADLKQLMPSALIDHSFALIRHPIDRMVSMYHYNIEVSGQLEAMPFGGWLDQVAAARSTDPYYLDNHPRPMVDFIPRGAKTFRLEDGTRPVVRWLDRISGTAEGARDLPGWNQRAKRGGQGARLRPAAAEIDRITQMYQTDFETFGYQPEEAAVLQGEDN
ncbi:MAG: sulfotransferase family protein [Gammaproteobacteria bacterium]|nr:sulfotransferase family protein [Gammaproteobacteria bacterium]